MSELVNPSAAGGAWEVLATVTATEAGTVSTGSFDARNFLHVMIFIPESGVAKAPTLRFNGNTSSIYYSKRSIDGGAASAFSAESSARLSMGAINCNMFFIINISNLSDSAKMGNYGADAYGTDGHYLGDGGIAWNNTAQVTEISLSGVAPFGSATLPIGTQIQVLGRD